MIIEREHDPSPPLYFPRPRFSLKQLLTAFTIVSLLLAGLLWFANAVATHAPDDAVKKYRALHPEKKINPTHLTYRCPRACVIT